MTKNVPIELLRYATHTSLTKELYILLNLSFQDTKAGWLSSAQVNRTLSSLFKTNKVRQKHLNKLVELGWVSQSNNNFHVKSLGKISKELGLIKNTAQSVQLESVKYLKNLNLFKAFILHSITASEIRQNYRRRYDKRYRVKNKKSGLEKIDTSRLSKTVGNQQRKITLTTGEYSYRLIKDALGFSLCKISNLFKLLRNIGEIEQYQQYCPIFDNFGFTKKEEVIDWINYYTENDTYNYHFKRIVNVKGKYRLKDLYLTTITLTISKRKYK